MVFFSFLESAWMLNCKLCVVVLPVGECNHMGLGFRGLQSVTRKCWGYKWFRGLRRDYRGYNAIQRVTKNRKIGIFPKGKSVVLVKDLRFCQFLVLNKILREKLFGYIFVKNKPF